MKTLKLTLGLSLIIFTSIFHVSSQVILSEGFETGSIPANWTEETVVGNEYWKYRNGGHSPNDPNWGVPAGSTDITRNPPSAYAGTYNAIFFKQSYSREKTKLITPVLNLFGKVKPELSFWVCQIPWTFAGTTNNDMLRIYYKTSAQGAWNLILELTDPILDWTEVKINLPNPSATYYIAFEGETYWGYGTCIDKVVVEEKGIVNRWIGELLYTHPILNFVPSGTQNVPILRLDFKVYGNTGTPILDSIAFTSLNTTDADISNNGVKLYTTANASFSTANPLGVATNFNESRDAIFDNLNYSLPDGQSYIWLAYDVSESAPFNNRLDAMVKANSILANDSLYPSTDQSPPGYRTIYKTIYFEDFEGTHGWSLTPPFIVGTPSGQGGPLGNFDPVGAYSGIKAVYHPGNYAGGLSEETAYKATSPTINLQHYKNIVLSYRRYLNLEIWDKASIQASTNNGATWNTIWTTNNYFSDYQWTNSEHTLSTTYWRSPNTKIRFVMGPTNDYDNYTGFTFDDVILTGEFISKDVGVVEWISPVTGCGHSNAETIIVKVANLGGADIVDPVPVQYTLNGTTWITNTISQNIPVGDTIEFAFSTKANLSTPGLRSNAAARTALSGDQYTSNNLFPTQFYVLPTYTPPIALDFEQSNGHWRSFGHNLWQYGTPAGVNINSAASGTKSWITILNGEYGDTFSGETYTIFEDDFETENGWTFSGEFERNMADWDHVPYYAYEGDYLIGTDLSGQGDSLFMYENAIIPTEAYTATSPPIDVSNYSNVKIRYYRYFEIQEGDSVKVEISPDNGVNWFTVWENDGQEIMDYWYEEYEHFIHDTLTFTNQLKVKFSLYYTSEDGSVAAGMNIDNFTVEGDIISTSPAYLESPCFNLASSTMPVFEAKLWLQTEQDKDGVTLEYSLDDGETWEHLSNTTIYDEHWNWYTGNTVESLDADGWSGLNNGWITVRQLLPEELVGESNVKFRFVFMCDGKNNAFDGAAIDDIKVYELPPDIGVLQIVSPSTACELSALEPITVEVKNFGLKELAIGDNITVGVKVEYSGDYAGVNSIASETRALTENLPANGTINFTFNQKFNLSISGQYTITAYTLIEDDADFFSATSNDTTSVVINVLKPNIELGPNIYTVFPDTVTLVATSSEEGILYNWYDNEELEGSLSTSSTFDVPEEGGQFWVTLENEGCLTVDSILVQKLLVDVGVSSFESPQSACELSEETPFTVWVTNFGTDTLKVGYTILLSYQIEAELPVEDIEWVLTEDVLPGDSILYAFEGLLMDMSAETDYNLSAWATIDYDNDDTNDRTDKTISVYGYPTFVFDPDEVTIPAIEYVVDADPDEIGWTAYYWHNDGSTDQYFTMDTTGYAKVTVYDENLCPATDSIFVNLQFTSIGVGDVISPFTACEFPDLVIPVFKIQNLGTNNLDPVTINYGYYLNDGEDPFETGTIVLTEAMLPNAFFESEFINSVDLSAPGEYTFKFFASYEGDPKPEDDILIHVVNVYGYPSLELGEDVYTRELDWVLAADPGADAYLWSTAETSQEITVTEDGTYSVTATNGSMCSVNDEINVTFLRHDYGISEFIGPETGCSQIDLLTVSAIFENFGNDTIAQGNQVLLGYIMNDFDPVEEYLELDEDFTPGSQIEFSFAEKVDLQFDGTYSFTVYSAFVGDFNTTNDAISESIDIYPVPYTYLGPDTIVKTGQIILYAGSDFESYLWQDESTLDSLVVEETGDYWVTITNEFGCSFADTINVISLTPDYGVIAITSPVNACSLSGNEKIYIRVKNFGTDTLFAGEEIPIRLYRNGVLQTPTEKIQIIEEFFPGDEIVYMFTKTLNLSAAGAYTIEAETFHSLDQNTENDKFTKIVNVWGTPAVTFPNLVPGTYCLNHEPIELTEATPEGGIYSGNGVVEGFFDPSVAGAGIHGITYTYTNLDGCTGYRNISVTVLALPVVTLSDLSPTCINTTPFALTGGSPTGGTYSGLGVSGGIFNPATAGVGTHDITYSYTDGNSCTNTAVKQIVVNDLTEVTFSAIDPVCGNIPAFELTGGSPTGGIYSGTGVNAGYFNPSLVQPGNNSITYTHTDGNGCVNFANSDVLVYEVPIVTLSAFDPVCRFSDEFELTGGEPEGGTYSGNGVVDGYFNPASVIAGNHNITYTYIDENSCSNSASSIIKVNPLPTVTLNEITPKCFNATPFVLSGGSPSGGIFSGDGVSSGIFNPSVAGGGTHDIVYTYTDGNGCSNSDTITVTVYDETLVALSSFSPICSDAEAFPLSGGTPVGGIYSGTGVFSGNFFASVVGVGTFTITYTYTDGNSCVYAVNSNITVNDIPIVTISTINGVYITAQPFLLTQGSPAGGVYSGDGILDNYFDPEEAGIGTHTITYTYTDGNGCSDFAETTITVHDITEVTFYGFDPVCIDYGPIELTGGGPEGGTYSGPGISEGVFYPDVAGSGTHTLTYTVIDGLGNPVSETVDVTVNPLPFVALDDFDPVCINSSAFVLSGGLPIDGTYSGNGISNGVFGPSTAGAGTHLITYSYTDGNGCTNSANTSITVISLPEVTIDNFDPVCVNSEEFLLVGGNPEGGQYSGPGVADGYFNPSNAGVGSITITYTYTDANSCANYATTQIIVNPIPSVSLSILEPVCENFEEFELSGGSPEAGVYSGTGVVDGNFFPLVAGVGTHLITYTFTDGNGCSNTAAQEIIVNSLPQITFSNFDPVCITADEFELTGAIPEGGEYSGVGVTDGFFNPQLAGAGNHSITYTFTDSNGCTNVESASLVVNSLPVVTINAFDPVCINTEQFLLEGAIPEGGEYSGVGVADGYFNPSNAGVGTHTITYSYTDGNGCSNSVSEEIVVNELPLVTFPDFDPICLSAPEFELTQANPEGGEYSGVGVANGFFNPATAGSGTHIITYTFTDINGCSNSSEASITIYDLPMVSLNDFDPVCIDADAFDLSGGSPEGGVYSGDGVVEGSFSPTTAGAGTHTITYSYTDDNGCVNSTTSEITVYALPVVTLPAFDPVCMDDEVFELTGGSPSGGDYSGQGVTNGMFNPASAGVGTHTILYSFIDLNGCSNNASAGLTVNELPVFDLGPDTLEVEFPYTLNAGISNVTYLWSDESTGSSITVTQTGTYWLTVTNTHGCSASDTIYLHSGNWIDIIPGTETIVSVYPNPVRGILTVDIAPNSPGEFVIELFSAQGQRLYHQKLQRSESFTKEINMSGYIPGIYLLKISTNGKGITTKIMVER
jgi:hypothetical protein